MGENSQVTNIRRVDNGFTVEWWDAPGNAWRTSVFHALPSMVAFIQDYFAQG